MTTSSLKVTMLGSGPPDPVMPSPHHTHDGGLSVKGWQIPTEAAQGGVAICGGQGALLPLGGSGPG